MTEPQQNPSSATTWSAPFCSRSSKYCPLICQYSQYSLVIGQVPVCHSTHLLGRGQARRDWGRRHPGGGHVQQEDQGHVRRPGSLYNVFTDTHCSSDCTSIFNLKVIVIPVESVNGSEQWPNRDASQWKQWQQWMSSERQQDSESQDCHPGIQSVIVPWEANNSGITERRKMSTNSEKESCFQFLLVNPVLVT